MTKTILVIAGVAIAAVLLGSALAVGMFTPKVEATENGNGIPSSTPVSCLPNEVKHWDKIIFQIVRDPTGTVMSQYLKTPLDIKVLDDPKSVANLEGKVRKFLIANGGAGIQPDSADIVSQLKLDIIDVEYAIVCVQQQQPEPDGFLLPCLCDEIATISECVEIVFCDPDPADAFCSDACLAAGFAGGRNIAACEGTCFLP